MIRKGKVIVAMSGGVDSSLAAALLKNRGYDVSGVFMRMHNKSNPKDAKIIAKKLGIRFKILNVQKEFKKKVVDYFISEYKKGRTPNPCVMCNKYIKFKFLIDKMLELKADFVATGHYARIRNSKLLVACDKTKDQSYFLWQLTQKQLAKIIFPIGDYTKIQVREMAKRFKLPVYNKKDSQEICFVNDLGNFLKKYIKVKPGPIITTDGKKVGEHDGLAFYTIGQRKGIEIGLPRLAEASRREAGGIGPFYVVEKDFKKNALIVAQGDFDKALFKKEMVVKNVNWINKPNLPAGRQEFPFRCKVKIRYGHKAVSAKISKLQTTKYKVLFNAPQRAITPGQSAVFYKGNELFGGGIIV
jgi:tRNA-specific 2-thiouridylase